MTLDSLILLLLIAGFVAAPFANLAVPRTRLLAAILLTATLSVLGCFAYAFDRSILSISAWWCIAAILMGVAICARVFIRHNARFALILGAVFFCTTAGFHFFGRDFARTCLRVQSSVQPGMTVNDVETMVLREFAKCADYHVVVGPTLPPDRMFRMRMAFDLRPDYVNLSGGSLLVDFFRGRATQAQATFASIWVAPWGLLGGIILYGICWWRLEGIAELEGVPRDDIPALFGRLRQIRGLGHPLRSGKFAVFAKKTLLHSATEKVRQSPYFDRSTKDSETAEVVAGDGTQTRGRAK